MNDEAITREDWEKAGVDQWRDTLTSAWEKDNVSLSATVWWIATGGEPCDCDDEELENAAKALLRQARSKDDPLAIKGRRNSVCPREDVPRNNLSDAMPFFGVDERMFLSGAPCVQWNPMLEDDRCDVIAPREGAWTWCDLSIEREAMRQLWPAAQDEVAVSTERAETTGEPLPHEIDSSISDGSQDEQAIQQRKPTKPVVIAAWLLSHFPVRTTHTFDEIAKLIRSNAPDIPLFSTRTFTDAIAIAYTGKEEVAELRKCAQGYVKQRKFK
jgi:hypothetical protein